MATWAINADLRGVSDVGIGSTKPDRGVYLCTITETERKIGEGKDSVRFTCKIQDGPFAGQEPWCFNGLDFTKEMNKKKLRTAVGAVVDYMADPVKGAAILAALDAGPIPLKDGFFLGKTVAVYVEPGEKLANGEWERDNNSIIRKAEYEKLKANGLPPLKEATEAKAPRKNGKAAKGEAPAAGADPFAETPAGATATGTQTSAAPAAAAPAPVVVAAKAAPVEASPFD